MIDFVSVIGRIAAARTYYRRGSCSIADKGEMFGLLIPRSTLDGFATKSVCLCGTNTHLGRIF